jgi:regulator of sigma E protease
MIGRLVMGEANVKNLSGPLSIAQFSGKSLEMGLSYFLYLLAILSVSLGVLNLLPIPMLDGGHLVYYSYEIITGRELPMNVQLIAQFAGIAILGLIMIIAFYNDFVRIFS